MPELVIDGKRVTVPAGATVLEAARQAGIEIPALCQRDGFAPSTSCMVCVVKDVRGGRLIPSCTAPAADGMEIESETDEVRAARRTALELLLSDHPADCLAPCEMVCPAGMAIPKMIRQIAAGDIRAAAATARAALVLPATLGRVCPAPCEKGCRRGQHDAAVAIRLLHRFAADTDLAAVGATRRAKTDLPATAPATGKCVAVVGAGPAGLAAAWHLLLAGHAVLVFDDRDAAGGALRHGVAEDVLPGEVLDAEVALIQRLGAAFRLGTRVGRDVALADLAGQFDAVLVAVGKCEAADAGALGLATAKDGLETDRSTYRTPTAGVFAAGDAVRPRKMAVRAVADGAAAAVCIDQYLRGDAISAPGRPFTTRLGRPEADELAEFVATASADGRVQPAGGDLSGFSADEARREAPRCLHCDCRAADTCLLRVWSDRCGAKPGRHTGTRRRVRIVDRHPEIVYEPGKCISCGLCIQVCERRRERLGLAFIGRGFDVRVGVPFDESLADGLTEAARECAAVCPTGALALKNT